MESLNQAIVNYMVNHYKYNLKICNDNHLIFRIDCNRKGQPTPLNDVGYYFSSFCKVTAVEHPKQSKFLFEYILDDQMASLKSVEYEDITREDFLQLEKQFLSHVRKLVKKR
jgi:hypothetical protein